MRNGNKTLASQFANSPKFLALLSSFNAAVDPGADIDAFFYSVWNIETATGYGLDVWGRIVGVTRNLTVSNGQYFGFDEATDAEPFGQSPFFSGIPTTTSNFVIDDATFRTLILVKALSNISNCSIKTYNTILMQLFPGLGNAYVNDTGNMTACLTFEFSLQPVQVSILKQSGVFTAPTGVKFQIHTPDGYF